MAIIDPVVERTAPDPAALPRGRTAALPPLEADRLLAEGVALFNAGRYWRAHEAWETLWRAAPDEERDFHQGLIKLAAGLLHLERRNVRGARNKLSEAIAALEGYPPAFRGIQVQEVLGTVRPLLGELEAGGLPAAVHPVIREAAE